MALSGTRVGIALCHSWTAEAAIAKWDVVRLSTVDGQVIINDSDGGQCIGVAQQKAALGQDVSVAVLGITHAKAHTTITKAVTLQAYSDGTVYAATTADNIIGFALEAAAAANDVIPILVVPAGIY